MAAIRGHALIHEGAPHGDNGYPIHYGGFISSGGDGRGKCECGALSDWLTSGNTRKAWHRAHKAEIAGEQ